MKQLPIAILLILFFATAGMAQHVTCETDEFTGEESCKTEWMNLIVEDSEASQLILRGAYLEVPEGHYLLFSYFADDWQWLDSNEIYFIIDGQRKNYELIELSTDIMDSGSVTETKILDIDTGFLEEISNARDVRFKISNDVGAFNTTSKQAIKNLLQATK